MKILWIEDQSKGTEEEFFSDSIRKHQIIQIKKFDDAFEKISNEIIEYDFVVMDLNLSESDIKDSKYAKKIISKYSIEEEEFVKEAGYHLAVELIVKKRFPLERIVFLTAYSDEGSGLINTIDEMFEKLCDGNNEGAVRIYQSNKFEFDDKWKRVIELCRKGIWIGA